MLVEAVVLRIVSMAANEPVPVPDLDGLRIDAQHLSHLFHCQHSGRAETIIPRRKLITPLNTSYDARGERLAFARLQALPVQHSSDLGISMVVQEPIDGGHCRRTGLPLFPGPLW